MLELTPWSPQTQTNVPQVSSDEELRARLRALVRWYLPRHEELTAKHWAFGRFVEAELVRTDVQDESIHEAQKDIRARHQVALGLFPDMRLQELEWRLVDERTVQGRFMRHWRVEGHAILAENPQERIDFLGEVLRDGVTGSFREFALNLVT